jgi:hypothetical protein
VDETATDPAGFFVVLICARIERWTSRSPTNNS